MSAPESLAVPLAELASLAVEHWRLLRALAPVLEHPQLAAARHALRQMEDFLRLHHLEAQSLDGLPYDAGMSARVVDRIAAAAFPPRTQVVSETLAPLVLYHGAVLRPAEIVISYRA